MSFSACNLVSYSVLISCTTVCTLIPVPLSSPEKNIPNTEPSNNAIRQITIITTTAIQLPATMAEIRAFVAAIIALASYAVRQWIILLYCFFLCICNQFISFLIASAYSPRTFVVLRLHPASQYDFLTFFLS